jgi:hypothetical protein
MSSLTLDLIVRPTHGWRCLESLDASADPWPQPLLRTGRVVLYVVLLTLIGASLTRDATANRVTLTALMATSGYLGAAVVSVQVASRWLAGSFGQRVAVGRFAAAAVMPLVASGVAFVLPFEGMWWLSLLVGCVLTGWSAAVGSRRYLGLSRARAHRTAALLAALASMPPLAATALRALVYRGG